MDNLEKRIEHLERISAPASWEEVDATTLQQRLQHWIESGGAARPIAEQEPSGMRILELLSIASQREETLMTLLERRIEKLEEAAESHTKRNALAPEEEEFLLKSMPPWLDDALERLSFEDLELLIEGREDELSPEAKEIYSEIQKRWNEYIDQSARAD